MYDGFTTTQLLKEYYDFFLREMYVDILNNEIISKLANTTITALPGIQTTCQYVTKFMKL